MVQMYNWWRILKVIMWINIQRIWKVFILILNVLVWKVSFRSSVMRLTSCVISNVQKKGSRTESCQLRTSLMTSWRTWTIKIPSLLVCSWWNCDKFTSWDPLTVNFLLPVPVFVSPQVTYWVQRRWSRLWWSTRRSPRPPWWADLILSKGKASTAS